MSAILILGGGRLLRCRSSGPKIVRAHATSAPLIIGKTESSPKALNVGCWKSEAGRRPTGDHAYDGACRLLVARRRFLSCMVSEAAENRIDTIPRGLRQRAKS